MDIIIRKYLFQKASEEGLDIDIRKCPDFQTKKEVNIWIAEAIEEMNRLFDREFNDSESVKPKPEDLKTIIENNFAIDKEWQDRIEKLGFHKKG